MNSACDYILLSFSFYEQVLPVYKEVFDKLLGKNIDNIQHFWRNVGQKGSQKLLKLNPTTKVNRKTKSPDSKGRTLEK